MARRVSCEFGDERLEPLVGGRRRERGWWEGVRV